MTAYERMNAHLNEHMYKRGANKGMAPAFARRMDHHLVYEAGDGTMRYKMYNTDLITAYSDGRVEFRFGNHESSSTTRKYFSDGALAFTGMRAWLSSDNQNGFHNTVLSTAGWSTAVRDQSVFRIDASGRLHPEDYADKQRYRADREKNKEVAKVFEPFKAMLPFLWPANEPTHRGAVYADIRALVRLTSTHGTPIDPESYGAVARVLHDATRNYVWTKHGTGEYEYGTWKQGWSIIVDHISSVNKVVEEVPC